MNMTDHLLKKATDNLPRVAALGGWGNEILERERCNVASIQKAPSSPHHFSAGLACALDLIPRDRQASVARLHGKSSEEDVAIAQIDLLGLTPDCAIVWWLATHPLTRKLNTSEFSFTWVERKRELSDASARLAQAHAERHAASSLFRLMDDGVPFTTNPDGLMAAYLNGYAWGVYYDLSANLFWIETIKPSLGPSDLAILTSASGSRPRTSASNFESLAKSTKNVRRHLGDPRPSDSSPTPFGT